MFIYVNTEMVCALIVRLLHKAWFCVKLALVVPLEDNVTVCAVVVIPVATGSIRLRAWPGEAR